MIQYFQLTPEILLEYIYDGDPKLNEDGIKGNIKDIYNSRTMLLKSNAFGSNYLCFANESEGLDSVSNLVLPLNNNETQFVVAKSDYQYFFKKTNASNIFTSKTGSGYIYENTDYDSDIVAKKESCDIKYDKCILHFTSKNFFGSYDSLIFQAYIYMKNKAKFYLTSFVFKKTSNREFKTEHLLYNEKLYTTQVEFDIPSVFAIFYPEQDNEDQKKFNDALKSQNIELLENTPIGINVYGVNSTILGVDNYVRLKTIKIKNVSIPYVYNRLDDIHVKIYEACDDKSRLDGDLDGDFYYIYPEMGSNYTSFVEYIESMGEDVRMYMIMHELCLREVWVDTDGVSHSEITHKELHIVNINADDENSDIINEFNRKIKYRPICTHGGANYRATIIDTIKVINTVDSSSYEVTGSLEIVNPYKYGKKLKMLNMNGANGNQIRPIVNVYNKKVTDENNTSNNLLGLNKYTIFSVENMTQNITSFMESTNIGVSIVELSPEDIN